VIEAATLFVPADQRAGTVFFPRLSKRRLTCLPPSWIGRRSSDRGGRAPSICTSEQTLKGRLRGYPPSPEPAARDRARSGVSGVRCIVLPCSCGHLWSHRFIP